MTEPWIKRLIDKHQSQIARIDTDDGPVYLLPPEMAWLVQFAGAKPAGRFLGIPVLEVQSDA